MDRTILLKVKCQSLQKEVILKISTGTVRDDIADYLQRNV
jgi:hypothetical protein